MLSTPLDLINATVQIDQPSSPGHRTVGTGFLVSATDSDGRPQTVLITANHVFADMKGAEVRVGFRAALPGGAWSFAPRPLRIRNAQGGRLWTAHPNADVAAIRIEAPPEFAKAAIPIGYLADQGDYGPGGLAPGDELFALGFPEGLAANKSGFPILRSGRAASYPLSPAASPTFLMDFAVYPGNSGGPVFATSSLQNASTAHVRPVIAGILTQQVEIDRHPLAIGIVTHARYVRETIDRLLGVKSPAVPAAARSQAEAQAPPPAPAQSVAGADAAAAPKAGRPLQAPLRWAGAALSWVRVSLADLLREIADLIDGDPAARSSSPAPFAGPRRI